MRNQAIKTVAGYEILAEKINNTDVRAHSWKNGRVIVSTTGIDYSANLPVPAQHMARLAFAAFVKVSGLNPGGAMAEADRPEKAGNTFTFNTDLDPDAYFFVSFRRVMQ